MKPQYLFLLTLFIAALCCLSCEKTPIPETPEVPADTTEIPMDTTEIIIPEIYPKEITFTEYSLKGTSYKWAVNHGANDDYDVSPYTGKLIAINNDEELKNYITGDNYPAIDFSKHTLLLAYGRTPQLIMDIISKRLQQVSENSYTLNIYIIMFGARMGEAWTCAFLIPKIVDEATVTLDVLQEVHPSIIWQVKTLSISGELTNIIERLESDIFYRNIRLRFNAKEEDTSGYTLKEGTSGYTFQNYFIVDYDIQENQQISFESYSASGTNRVEDYWGIAFKENLLNTVKYEISENRELIFFDSDNNLIIVFIRGDYPPFIGTWLGKRYYI